MHLKTQMFLNIFFHLQMGHFDWPITKDILKSLVMPIIYPLDIMGKKNRKFWWAFQKMKCSPSRALCFLKCEACKATCNNTKKNQA
jgi:hypothetical protein